MVNMSILITIRIEESCMQLIGVIISYTFKLEPLPDYSGEVHPSEANKCVILKEWTKREIEVGL